MDTKKHTGKVYIVGAGPGDPGLLTVKALLFIRKADAIIYDRLISKDILRHRKPGCALRYVGKRMGESSNQDEINNILLKYAKEGKAVVRLKGGDPFVFGRGHEEMAFLMMNGVDCETVPGVSSFYAVPEIMGIPLTLRGVSSGFLVVTGHEDPKKEKSGVDPFGRAQGRPRASSGFQAGRRRGVDWRQVAHFRGTVVIMMGLSNLHDITKRLIAEGKDAKTPAVVISGGTTKTQDVVFGQLSDIAKRASHLSAPAICVIGDVSTAGLRFRPGLKPLKNKRYLATASKTLNGDIASGLARYGASVDRISMIKVEPNTDMTTLDGIIGRVRTCDWLVFTSRHGVQFFMKRYREKGGRSGDMAGRVACVGSGTAAELKKYGVEARLTPSVYTTKDLAAALVADGVRGKRIALLRTKMRRDVLKPALLKAGAKVIDCITYFVRGSQDRESLNKAIAKKPDGVFFLSPQAAKTFFDLLPAERSARHVLGDTPFYSIGPVTTMALKRRGVGQVRSAKNHTVQGLVDLCLEESR